MPIVYKTGSLFDAPKGSLLLHAVNAQGVWGSGIAKQFHEKFPESFQNYHIWCQLSSSSRGWVGRFSSAPEENGYNIGWLCTSSDYGDKKDPKELVLEYTRDALLEMFKNEKFYDITLPPIHSCKFNAGLFGVPWEETEKVLLDVMQEVGYNNTWTVWSPKQGDLNA